MDIFSMQASMRKRKRITISKNTLHLSTHQYLRYLMVYLSARELNLKKYSGLSASRKQDLYHVSLPYCTSLFSPVRIFIERRLYCGSSTDFMLCCISSLNILKKLIFCIITGIFTNILVMAQKIWTLQPFCQCCEKNIPDPAPAEKQLAETSPKTGGWFQIIGTQLITCLSSFWNRIKLCKIFQGLRKTLEIFFETLLCWVWQVVCIITPRPSLRSHYWQK